MKIKTIEELKQRIGKFVVFSRYDENCNDKYATMKLLTKIEDKDYRIKVLNDNNQFYGHKIWGKFSANFIKKFQPYTCIRDTEETYSNCYLYARDPTEQELKQFKNCWRLKRYYEIR